MLGNGMFWASTCSCSSLWRLLLWLIFCRPTFTYTPLLWNLEVSRDQKGWWEMWSYFTETCCMSAVTQLSNTQDSFNLILSFFFRVDSRLSLVSTLINLSLFSLLTRILVILQHDPILIVVTFKCYAIISRCLNDGLAVFVYSFLFWSDTDQCIKGLGGCGWLVFGYCLLLSVCFRWSDVWFLAQGPIQWSMGLVYSCTCRLHMTLKKIWILN